MLLKHLNILVMVSHRNNTKQEFLKLSPSASTWVFCLKNISNTINVQ